MKSTHLIVAAELALALPDFPVFPRETENLYVLSTFNYGPAYIYENKIKEPNKLHLWDIFILNMYGSH
jgi:hypothetical protein